MEQTLTFEEAWDRTLADADREKIKVTFEKAKKHFTNKPIQFTALREAINHKGELLVSALIHNVSDATYSFHDQTLQFIDREIGKTMAERAFTIPRLTIEKYTSMPWTFIFPNHQVENIETLNGELIFKNEEFNVV